MRSGPVSVSVVIPTFNRPESLARALGSVRAQDLDGLEAIVVNDYGNRGPVERAVAMQVDERILLLENRRTKGANGARNTGIEAARGRFVAFLDDDDEWFPGKLKQQRETLEHRDEAWGGAYCSFLEQRGNAWMRVAARAEGAILEDVLSRKVSVCAGSTLMCRKEVFAAVGLFDEDLRRYQDLEFLARLLGRFKLAASPGVGARIFGHNLPQAERVEAESSKYLRKLEAPLASMTAKAKRRVVAQEYRDLSLWFAREGNGGKARSYLRQSLQSGLLPPQKYVQVLAYLAQGATRMPLGTALRRAMEIGRHFTRRG